MSEATSPRRLLAHPAGWIATGFGVGLAPIAPGTFGSLVALIPWWLWLRHLPAAQYGIVLVLALLVGIWAASWAIAELRVEDPGVVVWDEFLGQWIALFAAPAGWPWMLGGFALFRLFDIWKPWPVSWADRKLHGGLGAMLDDVLAGMYALAVLQLAELVAGGALAPT
jgi:phosphatidylglycerophosphatase A